MTILDAFAVFEDLSGQHNNNQKSHIYFGEGFSAQRLEDLIQLSGFKRGNFPVVYLGAPLFKGALSVLGCNRWWID